jgi:hypothetical protein
MIRTYQQDDASASISGETTMETLVLTGRDVAELLPMRACIEAVERAFRLLGRGEAAPPATLSVHAAGGGFHVKAGILDVEGRDYFAVKSNGNFPGNAARAGLPTIQGLVLLCDAADGRVLAVMDSGEITARRTAAATAVAARFLARPDARTVAICGCGLQGRAQLRALREVLPLERVLACDLVPGRAEAFAAEMAAELGGSTSDTRRPRCSSTDSPFIAASTWFTRRYRRSQSQNAKPIGASENTASSSSDSVPRAAPCTPVDGRSKSDRRLMGLSVTTLIACETGYRPVEQVIRPPAQRAREFGASDSGSGSARCLSRRTHTSRSLPLPGRHRRR